MQLEFLGTKTPEEINHLFQTASYFLHASSIETFCIVVPEAQKAGLPCIVSNIYPIPEIANDYGAIFVENTQDAWVEGLKQSQQTSFDRFRISVEMKERYSTREVGQAINSIYEAVFRKR